VLVHGSISDHRTNSAFVKDAAREALHGLRRGPPGVPRALEPGALDEFAAALFREVLSVPVKELEHLRTTEYWSSIVAGGKASLGDLRALSRYDFARRRAA
jgi:hypothetical protein